MFSALNIHTVHYIIDRDVLSIYNRSFCVSSPHQSLCSHVFSLYILSGTLVKGTLIDKFVQMGTSPVQATRQREALAQRSPQS